MEELPADLLDELDRTPEKKKRKSKVLERTYRAWFYDIATHNGDCDNPKCKDPRNKAKGVTQVWDHPTANIRMCRYCFLNGWLQDD